jgi:hypothetical protein
VAECELSYAGQVFYITALVDLPSQPDEIKHLRAAAHAGQEVVLARVRDYGNGLFDTQARACRTSAYHLTNPMAAHSLSCSRRMS